MKNYLTVLILLFIGNMGFCDYSFSQTTYTPKYFYYQKFPQSFSSPNIYYSPRAFNNLEKKILNHNFMAETPSQRLNRMEEAAFGSIQTGNELERYRVLQKAFGKNSYSKYYSPNHNLLRKSIFSRNFSGMPTGFTPPVRSYDDYNSPFEKDYNFQSGMKFKIIDD